MSYYSGVYSIFHRFIKDYVNSLQPDKTNRYVYCYNNPINLIDPLGLSDRDPNEQEIRPPDPAPTPSPQTQPTPPHKQKPPSQPQEGQTAQDVKETIGLEKKDPLQVEKNTMPQPEPVPKPSPEATATLTPRQGMNLKNANLTYDQVLNQNNRTAQELHETLQPTGRAADIIQWVSVPFLFVPATAPAAAVAVSASSYAGLIAKLGDAAVTKDPLKAAGALGELALGTFAGKAAARVSGLEPASFNWGSIRYHSEATGRFVGSAAGRTYNAVQYSVEALVSVPLAVNEYKKPETP